MKINITVAAVAASLLLSACGGGGNGGGNSEGVNGGGSHIPYLRENHANYSQDGSNMTPAPTKDATSKTISWTISAKTEDDAAILADHIRYMEAQLKADKNPRAFDKLFLMEAYMKYNNQYTTSIEQSGKSVVITKEAKNSCAYDVIAAHSDAVSGDFFARGDIHQNYSSKAEQILASSDCQDQKAAIEAYISQRQRGRR